MPANYQGLSGLAPLAGPNLKKRSWNKNLGNIYKRKIKLEVGGYAPSKQGAGEKDFKLPLKSGQGAEETGGYGMPLEPLWSFKEGVRRQDRGWSRKSRERRVKGYIFSCPSTLLRAAGSSQRQPSPLQPPLLLGT